jgi:hypothetical protein
VPEKKVVGVERGEWRGYPPFLLDSTSERKENRISTGILESGG